MVGFFTLLWNYPSHGNTIPLHTCTTNWCFRCTHEGEKIKTTKILFRCTWNRIYVAFVFFIPSCVKQKYDFVVRYRTTESHFRCWLDHQNLAKNDLPWPPQTLKNPANTTNTQKFSQHCMCDLLDHLDLLVTFPTVVVTGKSR